jgi:hypothetical protein
VLQQVRLDTISQISWLRRIVAQDSGTVLTGFIRGARLQGQTGLAGLIWLVRRARSKFRVKKPDRNLAADTG